ncbi:MAG: hypothetical protein MZU79_04680 [Anaerotruncus sp.]|nr:hypothetical protein [Anaerotruncus sp.]
MERHGGLHLRLPGRRLGLRRQRRGHAPGPEGLHRRRRRGRPALARRRFHPPELEPAQVPLAARPRPHGTWRLRLLNSVFILAGAGVGGGSLNYANTLYVPPDVFFERPSVRRLGGREELLRRTTTWPSRMLGVVRNPVETAQDVLMRETAAEIGRERDLPADRRRRLFRQRRASPPPIPTSSGEGPDRDRLRALRRSA